MSETKIDAITLEINASSNKAYKGLEKLADSLEKLKTSNQGIQNVVSQLNALKNVIDGIQGSGAAKELKNIAKGIEQTGKSAEKSAGKVSRFGGSFKQFASSLLGVNLGAAGLGQAFRYAIGETNDYVEALNYASQVLGDYYPQAKQYAERIQDLMGIDSKDFLQAQTSFMTMGQGFGLASDKAFKLSKGLTELGYDISSITNSDITTVMQRLQSAVAGEIEPVRRWGVALDQASMKEWLMKKGLDANVSSMNQASKALIRYNMLVETMNKNGVIGDMARTLSSPANALRILKQQFTQLARAIGSVFIPVIIQVIPYVQAFVSVLTDAIKKIAAFFGFKIPNWSNQDWEAPVIDLNDGLDDTNDGLDSAIKKAKEFKKQLMGFDELNIIAVPTETTSDRTKNDTPSIGSDLGLDAPDVWNEAMLSGIETKVESLKSKMEPLLITVAAIGGAFATWKIANGFVSMFGPEGALVVGMTNLATVIMNNPILSQGLMAKLFPGNVLATVGGFVTGIASLALGFLDLATNNEKFKTGLSALGTILETVKKKIEEFFKKIGIKLDLSSLDSLSESLNDATNGWVSLGDAAVLFGALLIGGGPLALAVGAGVLLIKGLGWAFEEVETDTGETMPRYKKLWGDFKTWFGGKVDDMHTSIEGFRKKVRDFLSEKWDTAKTGVISAFETVKNKIDLSGKAKAVGDALGKVRDKISNFSWKDAKDKLKEKFDAVKGKLSMSGKVTAIGKTLTGVRDKIKDFSWKDAKDKLGEGFKKIREKISLSGMLNGLKTSANGIIGVIEGIANKGIKAINGLVKAMNDAFSITIPSWVPGIGGNKYSLNIPYINDVSIPRFAKGGFPEEGPFMMNRGEIAGKFSNGKGVVANNMQIIEGISQGVQNGIMAGYRYANMNAPTVKYDASSLAEQMTSSGQNRDQNITVTLNVDGQEMARKVFKVHNSTVKQTGRSPLMI